jgi:hypothetical protein
MDKARGEAQEKLECGVMPWTPTTPGDEDDARILETMGSSW